MNGRVGSRWYSWPLTIIRVVMGAFFLMEAEHQLTEGYIGGDGLEKKFREHIDTAIPPYDWLIEHVFLKIDDPLTVLVIAGEIVVGVALVLGLPTPFTAIVALFMNVNFLLMNGLHADSGGVDAAFVVGEVLLVLYAPYQALSVDRWLAKSGVSSSWLSGEPEHEALA
jgi:thiosulfate dehydrogenase (quinone) large subunit